MSATARQKRRPLPPGPGRPRGIPNQITREVRETLRQFIDGNADQLQSLFDRVAKKSPARAIELYARLCEFVLPKLVRTELRLPPAQLPDGPILDAEQAAQIYQQILGDTGIDLSGLTFGPSAALPAPAVREPAALPKPASDPAQ